MAAWTASSTAPAGSFRSCARFSIKGWNTVINTNLNGTWYMMQATAQRWRDHKHPGSIVNIVVVTTHGLRRRAYDAARSGVIGLSRSVAVESAPLNIGVNCVAPGTIETEGWNVYTPQARATYPRSNPMMGGRRGISPKRASTSPALPENSSPAKR